jgi:phytol kinase
MLTFPPGWHGENILQHIPTWEQILRWSPAIIAFIVSAGWISGTLKRRFRLKTNYSRKIFHFLIFSLATTLHWQLGLEAVNLLGAWMGVYLAAILTRAEGDLFYEALAREQDAPQRSFYIIISYLATAAGGVVSNLLFGPHALVGYLVTGWGDAIGEPVGARFGRHRYRVPTLGGVICHRSWEGSAAVAVTSWLAAALALHFALELPMSRAVTSGLLIAALATAVEAFSFHGLDNFTIQIAAAGLSFLLIATK